MPGILGTRLVDPDSGRLIWGAFGGKGVNPRDPEGARLTALPRRRGVPLSELRDGIEPAGVLDTIDITFVGLPFQLNAYAHILAALGAGGYRDEELGLSGAIDYGGDHFTCFQFPYDWRRDTVENARRLKEFMDEKRAYVHQEIKKRCGIDRHDIKFDIIAHSMGGLVTRCLMRYGDRDLPEDGSEPEITWAGADYVERVILVGTPNAGSLHAFIELVQGVQFAPLFAKHEAAILGTFPSIYQLMPRTRHATLVQASDGKPLDVYDFELWKANGWGLAAKDQDWILEYLLPDAATMDERREIAFDHLRKCLVRARRFARALDKPASPPGHLKLYLVAGDAVPTPSIVEVHAQTGMLDVKEKGPGDGTVPRSSALLDERVGGEWTYSLRAPIDWENVFFLFSDHLGMTMDPSFTDNVLYLLFEDPR